MRSLQEAVAAAMTAAQKVREQELTAALNETNGVDTAEALRQLLTARGHQHLLPLLPDSMTVTEYVQAAGMHTRDEVDQIRTRQAECARCPDHGGECATRFNSRAMYGKVASFDPRHNTVRHLACDKWARFEAWARMGQFNVGARYRECALMADEWYSRPYLPQNETQEAALAECLRYVRSVRDTRSGMILQGPPGTGKTHLAVGILRALRNRSSALMLYTPTLIDRLGMRRSSEERDEVIARCIETPLLVLDDLGAGEAGAYEQAQLTMLVTERAAVDRPILVTTNDPITTFRDKLGARVVSRLGEHVVYVDIEGEDYRLRGQV